jgi:hypothetical protein
MAFKILRIKNGNTYSIKVETDGITEFEIRDLTFWKSVKIKCGFILVRWLLLINNLTKGKNV